MTICRKLAIVCTFVLFAVLSAAVSVYAHDVRVIVNEEEVLFTKQPPVIIDGRTLVPAREVFEALGFVSHWNSQTGRAILLNDEYTIVITIGRMAFTTNGTSHLLEIPAQVIGGSTMIPLRAILESIGYHLRWDNVTRTVIISSTPLRAPMVALTFDDGPSLHTERILDVLEHYNARATFFMLGYRVERHRNTVIRAANMGNEIAGHTWTHSHLTRLSAAEIWETIESTSAIIMNVTGNPPPRFYRPPFGLTNNTVRYVSTQMGYSIVNWDLDTLDWRYRNADTIYRTIMDEITDGSVILLHDIHLTTAMAIERVVPSLIAQGFRLVTLSELMDYFYGELEPGRIYGRVYDDDLPHE